MITKKKVKIGKNFRFVPVNEDGMVPREYLEKINSKRNPRSRAMDSVYTAKRVFTVPVALKDAARWINRPNKFDIEGIDSPVKKTLVAKTPASKPKAKQQASEDMILIAGLFKHLGREVTTSDEFVMTASLDLKWLRPSDAREFLELMIAAGHLEARGGFVRPTFDIRSIDVPKGFRPNLRKRSSPVTLDDYYVADARNANFVGSHARKRMNGIRNRSRRAYRTDTIQYRPGRISPAEVKGGKENGRRLRDIP